MAAGRVLVVGGGIGGLAAGVALADAGWQVTLCERGTLEPAGAGISLWPNALRALDRIRLGDAVRSAGRPVTEGSVRRSDGRLVTHTRLPGAVRARFGDPLVVLARPVLSGLLAARLPDGVLRTGCPVADLVPGDAEHPARARCGDRTVEADLVVGADGIGSGARAAAFPTHPGTRYAGYTTWRFLTRAPGAAGSETWGTGGQRFAIVPMADGEVYCYATATRPEGERCPDEADELRRRFGGWHAPIPTLLDGLTGAGVLHHDVRDLAVPLPAFHRGRLALVGDAAHAMTPELGQGGCLALEDAVTLAAVVAAAPDLGPGLVAALGHYTALRRERTQRLVRRSHAAARVNQASAPLALAARCWSARLAGRIPPRLAVRGLAPVVDWTPPGPVPGADFT